VQLTEGSGAGTMKRLALSAHVVCAQVRNSLFVGADVDFSVAGDRGVFTFTPVTMHIMGGKGSGIIDADFAGAIPAYRVHYAVMQLHVDDLFQSLVPGKVGDGVLDFTADLSMRGRNAVEMTRTAQGVASLRGKNLEIAIGNLDEKLSHYESSQNFNLVDVGAFFIAGPLGAVATKGYDFASVFQGTKGKTEIRRLVSEWKVESGVAHAQDVAMATKENRLAMKGSLDFVNREFVDVTVAILDHKGCARVEQRIRGPFSKPDVEQPNVLASLTGPISSLFGKAKKLLGGKCEVFYQGSVQP
jgi:AsmA protein